MTVQWSEITEEPSNSILISAINGDISDHGNLYCNFQNSLSIPILFNMLLMTWIKMKKHTYLSNFQVKLKESINTMPIYNRINNNNSNDIKSYIYIQYCCGLFMYNICNWQGDPLRLLLAPIAGHLWLSTVPFSVTAPWGKPPVPYESQPQLLSQGYIMFV